MNKKYKLLSFSLIATLLMFINSCSKDESNEPEPVPNGTVEDIDGNVYHTVTLGTQVWMVENLRTTKYRDGSSIPNIKDNIEWTAQTAGAYCWYDNDTNNKATYGALYNWFTVSDSRNLAPAGWHIPTDSEWTTLINFLGGESVAGGKLKATNLWSSPNTGANNSSGFTAFPGGVRNLIGWFNDIGRFGIWWSATELSGGGSIWYRGMYYSNQSVARDFTNKWNGIAVRCVKD